CDDTYGTSYGFGDGSPTSAELKTYLVAITKELFRCTALLVAEWDNTKSDLLNYSAVYSAGDEEEGNYYTTFTEAGTGNSEYPNQSVALSTIVEAAGGIADEVGSVKIADPITSGSVLDVESWFSHNSVTDFTNNIIGIKEAYYGVQYTDSATSSSTTSGSAASDSISAYIASGNKDLDDDIKDAIDTAIDAVNAMIAPFRNNLTWDANNTAAATACNNLLEALETAQEAINDGWYVK
ncbi:MAG: imelysin family protein, partial [Rikenellaceae bacterium]